MLKNRSLLGLISAELVSLTGTAMTFVALPWFVLVATDSVRFGSSDRPSLAGTLPAGSDAEPPPTSTTTAGAGSRDKASNRVLEFSNALRDPGASRSSRMLR